MSLPIPALPEIQLVIRFQIQFWGPSDSKIHPCRSRRRMGPKIPKPPISPGLCQTRLFVRGGNGQTTYDDIIKRISRSLPTNPCAACMMSCNTVSGRLSTSNVCRDPTAQRTCRLPRFCYTPVARPTPLPSQTTETLRT